MTVIGSANRLKKDYQDWIPCISPGKNTLNCPGLYRMQQTKIAESDLPWWELHSRCLRKICWSMKHNPPRPKPSTKSNSHNVQSINSLDNHGLFKINEILNNQTFYKQTNPHHSRWKVINNSVLTNRTSPQAQQVQQSAPWDASVFDDDLCRSQSNPSPMRRFA